MQYVKIEIIPTSNSQNAQVSKYRKDCEKCRDIKYLIQTGLAEDFSLK